MFDMSKSFDDDGQHEDPRVLPSTEKENERLEGIFSLLQRNLEVAAYVI